MLADDPEAHLKWLKEQCDWFVDEGKSSSDQGRRISWISGFLAGFVGDQI
jgi:hypothetical protein